MELILQELSEEARRPGLLDRCRSALPFASRGGALLEVSRMLHQILPPFDDLLEEQLLIRLEYAPIDQLELAVELIECSARCTKAKANRPLFATVLYLSESQNAALEVQSCLAILGMRSRCAAVATGMPSGSQIDRYIDGSLRLSDVVVFPMPPSWRDSAYTSAEFGIASGLGIPVFSLYRPDSIPVIPTGPWGMVRYAPQPDTEDYSPVLLGISDHTYLRERLVRGLEIASVSANTYSQADLIRRATRDLKFLSANTRSLIELAVVKTAKDPTPSESEIGHADLVEDYALHEEIARLREDDEQS